MSKVDGKADAPRVADALVKAGFPSVETIDAMLEAEAKDFTVKQRALLERFLEADFWTRWLKTELRKAENQMALGIQPEATTLDTIAREGLDIYQRQIGSGVRLKFDVIPINGFYIFEKYHLGEYLDDPSVIEKEIADLKEMVDYMRIFAAEERGGTSMAEDIVKICIFIQRLEEFQALIESRREEIRGDKSIVEAAFEAVRASCTGGDNRQKQTRWILLENMIREEE